VTSSFSKSSVFTVHTKTRNRSFQKFPPWRAFSKSCVFGHRFHRLGVDGRPIRKEKVAFYNENGNVWTESEVKGNRAHRGTIKIKTIAWDLLPWVPEVLSPHAWRGDMSAERRLVGQRPTDRPKACNMTARKPLAPRVGIFSIYDNLYLESCPSKLAKTTVFTRLNAAAFIKFLAFPMRRLFKGGVYSRATFISKSYFLNH